MRISQFYEFLHLFICTYSLLDWSPLKARIKLVSFEEPQVLVFRHEIFSEEVNKEKKRKEQGRKGGYERGRRCIFFKTSFEVNKRLNGSHCHLLIFISLSTFGHSYRKWGRFIYKLWHWLNSGFTCPHSRLINISKVTQMRNQDMPFLFIWQKTNLKKN